MPIAELGAGVPDAPGHEATAAGGEVSVDGLLRIGGWIACLGLAALLARDAAGLTWQFLGGHHEAQLPRAAGGPPPGGTQGVDARVLAALHLFGASTRSAAETPPPPRPGPERVQLALRGVFLSDEPGETRAYIAAADGTQGTYRLDEALPGGARLVEVHADWVIVTRGPEAETLRLERTPGQPAAAPATEVARDKRTIVNNRANRRIARDLKTWQARLRERPEALLGLLAVSPVSEGAVMKGFRLLPGSEEGLLRRLGLSPGDIVVNVNGTPLDTLEGGLAALRGLASARDISLEVVRGDKALVFQYRVGS